MAAFPSAELQQRDMKSRERLLQREDRLRQQMHIMAFEFGQLDDAWSRHFYESKEPSSAFTCFPNLPLELRRKIWRCAAFPRIIEFECDIKERDELSVQWEARRYLNPVISKVNHESREVFLKMYSLLSLPGRDPIYIHPAIDPVFIRLNSPLNFHPGSVPGFRNTMEFVDDLKTCIDLSLITTLAISAQILKFWAGIDGNGDQQPIGVLNVLPNVEELNDFPNVEEIVFVMQEGRDGYHIPPRWIEYNDYYSIKGGEKDRSGRVMVLRSRLTDGVNFLHQSHHESAFLAPFQDHELYAWERIMSIIGHLKYHTHGGINIWDGIRFSVATYADKFTLANVGPLVSYEATRYGPPNSYSYLYDPLNPKYTPQPDIFDLLGGYLDSGTWSFIR